jgi:hypothetical protein
VSDLNPLLDGFDRFSASALVVMMATVPPEMVRALRLVLLPDEKSLIVAHVITGIQLALGREALTKRERRTLRNLVSPGLAVLQMEGFADIEAFMHLEASFRGDELGEPGA